MFARTLRAAAGALLLVSAAQTVSAQVVTGTTVGGPTFTRRNEAGGFTCGGASTVGTAVRYSTFNFFTPTAGAFTFTLTGVGGWDTFLFLYNGAFNPANPAANCFAANDDIVFGVNLNSQLTRTLAANSVYTAVVTGYANSSMGAWSLSVTGPALIVVPEPPQVVLMATGLLGMGLVARKRRRA